MHKIAFNAKIVLFLLSPIKMHFIRKQGKIRIKVIYLVSRRLNSSENISITSATISRLS